MRYKNQYPLVLELVELFSPKVKTTLVRCFDKLSNRDLEISLMLLISR